MRHACRWYVRVRVICARACACAVKHTYTYILCLRRDVACHVCVCVCVSGAQLSSRARHVGTHKRVNEAKVICGTRVHRPDKGHVAGKQQGACVCVCVCLAPDCHASSCNVALVCLCVQMAHSVLWLKPTSSTSMHGCVCVCACVRVCVCANVYTKQGSITPSTFQRSVSQLDSRWGDGSQQDAQEFLHALLEALQVGDGGSYTHTSTHRSSNTHLLGQCRRVYMHTHTYIRIHARAEVAWSAHLCIDGPIASGQAQERRWHDVLCRGSITLRSVCVCVSV